MKKFRSAFLAAAAAVVFIAFSAGCAEAPFAPAGTPPPAADAGKSAARSSRVFDVLSRHDVRAVFAGTREHVCRGRTALCPDRCGASGTLAVFRIEKYNAYEKRSEYGDPQTDEFVFMLGSGAGTQSGVPEKIAERVRALAPGDEVRLVWEHVYVTDENGSRFPERRVLELSEAGGD